MLRSLVRERKTPLQRRFVILEPLRGSKRFLPSSTVELYETRQSLEETLNRLIQRVQRTMPDRSIPRVRLVIDRQPLHRSSVVDLLENDRSPADIRGISAFATLTADHRGSSLETFQIPFLVALECADAGHGWHKGDGVVSARLRIPEAFQKLALLDLALDAAMFAAYFPGGTRSIQSLQTLAAAKASFALHEQLPSHYGPIFSSELSYFCFASAIRRTSELSDKDIRDYIDVWTRFASTAAASDPQPQSQPNGLSPTAFLARFPRFAGQINLRVFHSKVSQLLPGEYILVLARRKPRSKSVARDLSEMFGYSRWRTNRWIIEPAWRAERWDTFEPYLFVVPLTKSAEGA